ncbi:unnamed protein product [Amoebophrya sp. A25]|nr:unnamed protein product [Amoebophrya sp. A25]|eukprot:GSA25T00018640001.1
MACSSPFLGNIRATTLLFAFAGGDQLLGVQALSVGARRIPALGPRGEVPRDTNNDPFAAALAAGRQVVASPANGLVRTSSRIVPARQEGHASSSSTRREERPSGREHFNRRDVEDAKRPRTTSRVVSSAPVEQYGNLQEDDANQEDTTTIVESELPSGVETTGALLRYMDASRRLDAVRRPSVADMYAARGLTLQAANEAAAGFKQDFVPGQTPEHRDIHESASSPSVQGEEDLHMGAALRHTARALLNFICDGCLGHQATGKLQLV